MNTIEFIIIFLLIANSYILVRNEFVYKFGKKIAQMSYNYDMRNIHTDSDSAFDWFAGKHSYLRLLFSFKPLRLECWFTKYELHKINS